MIFKDADDHVDKPAIEQAGGSLAKGPMVRAESHDIREKLEATEAELEATKTRLAIANSDIEAKDIRLKYRNDSLKRTHADRDYQRKKVAKEQRLSLEAIQNVPSRVEVEDVSGSENELERLKEEVIQLREDVKLEREAKEAAMHDLRQARSSIIINAKVQGGDKDSGKAAAEKKKKSLIYDSNYRHLCYGLISRHVGHARHVQSVIDLVLKYAGKEVAYRPCKAQISRFSKERLPLAQFHVASKKKKEKPKNK